MATPEETAAAAAAAGPSSAMISAGANAALWALDGGGANLKRLGLFGGGPSEKAVRTAARRDYDNYIRGIRQAANKRGFNPLTLLGTGGQSAMAAASAASAPPLASNDLLLGAAKDFAYAASGEEARDLQRSKFELERAQLLLEEARRGKVPGGAVVAPGRAGSVTIRPGYPTAPTQAFSLPGTTFSAGTNVSAVNQPLSFSVERSTDPMSEIGPSGYLRAKQGAGDMETNAMANAEAGTLLSWMGSLIEENSKEIPLLGDFIGYMDDSTAAWQKYADRPNSPAKRLGDWWSRNNPF